VKEKRQHRDFAVPPWSALIICVASYYFGGMWLTHRALEDLAWSGLLTSMPATLAALAFGTVWLWRIFVKSDDAFVPRLMWRIGMALLLFGLAALVVLTQFTGE